MNNLYRNHNKILWQEADFYGAANLIFKKDNKPLIYRASWMHGMGYSFSGIRHINSFIHQDEVDLPEHYVNNSETVSYLKKKNINSTSIGMPFIYTLQSIPSKNEREIDNLFIPEHNILNTQENKFDYYLTICKKYNCNNLLLSGNDYLKAKELQYNFGSINILCGSNITNPNSLTELSKLLQSTKNVFSDVFGSHLYYALTAGCKLELIEEIRNNYNKDTNLERIKSISSSVTKSFKKEISVNFPIDSLLNGIWGSASHFEKKEYSDHMLGLSKKISKSALINGFTPISNLEKFNLIVQIFKKKLKRKLSI